MKRKTRKGARPDFRLAFFSLADRAEYHRVFHFRRHWGAIAAVAAFDAAFLYPAIGAFQQALSAWSRLESLFDLTGALFLTGWLMGWSVAPVVLTAVLLLMIFGRETITASPGRVELLIGLPFFGIGAIFDPAKMRNLRLDAPVKASGTAWRGQHGVFDYGANPVAFGSSVDESDLVSIREGLQWATGTAIRQGDATAGELEGEWGHSPLHPRSNPAQPGTPSADNDGAPAPLSLTSPSALMLILANLVPVYGAAWLGWELSDVMVLYWAESAVVGFYNVLKMIVIGRWFAILSVPFFIGHFGAFMAVHFLFLYSLFVKGPDDMTPAGLTEVAQLFLGLWPGLAALFISHGFSFLRNFISRKEYIGRGIKTQMAEPYGRIIFMHLVLIFGGGIALILGEPTPVLLIVIALKIGFDVKAHLRQHYASGRPIETPKS